MLLVTARSLKILTEIFHSNYVAYYLIKIYLHLQAQIIAEAGPIIIGENNMIEERARIINAKDPNATSETTRVMIIGKNLWIKVMLQGLRLKAFLI